MHEEWSPMGPQQNGGLMLEIIISLQLKAIFHGPSQIRPALLHVSPFVVLAQNEIQAMQNEIHSHTEKINEQNQESRRC